MGLRKVASMATPFSIEVQPTIPPRLARLSELSENLRYTWDRRTRGLFARLEPQLWDDVGHNPKVFLRRVSQSVLEHAATDTVYLDEFDRIVARHDAYMAGTARGESSLPDDALIAYFSAEFGFHESVNLYSGGLGILAADHCKAASDMSLPFVGVSLLYRQGYFNQTIDAEGNQIVSHRIADFADLPIAPVFDENGGERTVHLRIAGRSVAVRIWRAQAGRVALFLLDTDLPENDPSDREITHQLYGGDQRMRICQEIVMGIGGVRALRAVGLAPTVWHLNEGHAAFAIIERARELVAAGHDFDTAFESVAGSTVFTTHTPVPAGHDVFSESLVDEYFHEMYAQLGIDRARFMNLGFKSDEGSGFNQTALAIRGSRYRNAVSRIHRRTSARLSAALWPQIPDAENPIDSVTNGVHVATFLARDWVELFDSSFGGEWRNRIRSTEYWENLSRIPNHMFWSIRQTLKSRLLEDLRVRLRAQYVRNGIGDFEIDRALRYIDPTEPTVLTIGFARRFATYKRATLLLQDEERFHRLLSNTSCPVLVIFAGKAHPADHPGQELIRRIARLSERPEFNGRILLVEGYDLALGRQLVAGVDVWLNTPEYPLEASGTSGQKAAINGGINLSVLDGWWGEGYDGTNGWAIKPSSSHDADRRLREEATQLYDILESAVIPLYYERNIHGYSQGWIERSKRSMATILPRFNAERMVGEYVDRLYAPADARHRMLDAGRLTSAKTLADWLQRVRLAWPHVALRRVDAVPTTATYGEPVCIDIAAALRGLSPEDVRIELVAQWSDAPETHDAFAFGWSGIIEETQEHRFTVEFAPKRCGLLAYNIRAYPRHALLAHPHETGLMTWL